MAPISLGKKCKCRCHLFMWQMQFGCSHWLCQVQQLLNRVYVLVASVVSESLRPHEVHTAQEAPLSMGFSRQELEWVAISSSRGSSWPRDHTHISYVSCTGRQVLYRWATSVEITTDNFKQEQMCWLWCCWYCLLWTTHTHSHTGSQPSTIFLAIPCIACSLELFGFHWESLPSGGFQLRKSEDRHT